MKHNASPFLLILALALPATAMAAEADGGDVAAEASETLVAQGDLLMEDGDDQLEDDVEAELLVDEEVVDEKDARELPIDISIGTSLSMSAGNLRPNLPETEQDDSLLNSWNLGVGRDVTDDLSASLSWGFYKFLTRAGGLNQQREFRVNDISVGLAYSPVYVIPRADVRVSASLSGVIPISRISRTSTLRTSISPSLTFSRSFGNLLLSYRLGASKRFHRFTSSVVDATDVDAIRRDGGAEDISANEVALAGVNTEWSWVNNVSASYRWFEGFSTSLTWGYARSWGYNVTDCDEFSSDFARCNGRVARDSMTGSIGAAYSFLDHYSVSLSASTAQRPKTADNRRINFPFWDVQTPGLFNTQLSLGFSASF